MQNKNKHIHFAVVRLLLLGIGIILGTGGIVAAENPIEVIQTHGKLFEQLEDKYQEVEQDGISKDWKRLRVGEEIEYTTLLESPEKLADAYSILRINARTLVTLPMGAVFGYGASDDEKNPLYTFMGTASLLLDGKKDQEAARMLINGLHIETRKVHLFVNSLGEKPQLIVVEGELVITVPVEKEKPAESEKPAADATADATADTVKPAAEAKKVVMVTVLEKVKLSASDRITLKKGGYTVEHGIDLKSDAILVSSTVPGFETPGPYKNAGRVGFNGDVLEILRYGKSNILKTSPALLMESDKVITADNQNAVIQLTDRDTIRLSGNSHFTIAAFDVKEKSIISELNFTGRIRARIAKRKKRSKVLFKTATAVIGIKGTVFESTASAESTSVETVQGTVGVSDPNGQGEVDVKAGEMTSVAADELPKPPEPIPQDRWQQLQQGLIPVAAATAIPIEQLRILSPASGQSYKVPVIQLEVEPDDATLVFQLNGKPFAAENEDTLHHLPEGQHQLTVSGAADGSTPQTVSFVIDRTAPLLFPDRQLAGLTLKQFMPLNISWNEPLSFLAVTYNNTLLKHTLAADSKTAVIDTSQLFVGTSTGQMVNLAIEARDAAGNTGKLQEAIQIKHRPTTPPFIAVEGGKQTIRIKEPRMITAMSDRNIEQWTILLNQQQISLLHQPQAEAAPVNKKILMIPPVQFSQLTEGKHVLTISGADDFGLVGKQTLEIILDQTPPALMQPLTLLNAIQVTGESRMLMLSNLVVKEGESLMLHWVEPVVSIQFKLDRPGIPFPVIQLPDRTSVQLDAQQLKQLLGGILESPVTLEATDISGNKTTISGNIRFLPKPAAPPAISVKAENGSVLMKRVSDMVATADREIFQWQVELDNQPVVLPAPSTANTGAGSLLLKLKKDVFPKLADGEHVLAVTGTDRFRLAGAGKYTFSIDSRKPELIRLSGGAKLSLIKLKQNETVELTWNEKLSGITAVLNGKPWQVVHSATGTDVVLKGDNERLTYEPKPFQLKATDSVGNTAVVAGRIALKKPRKLALEDAYKETILETTKSPTDEMVLTNRPLFQLNNSKPVIKVETRRLLDSIEFKQKPSTEFFLHLDEPLINSF